MGPGLEDNGGVLSWPGCQDLPPGWRGVRSEGAPDPLPIDPPLAPLRILQGVIRAVKELDYEISHGRYTLLVTATDQCPVLSHRLTSTTTVGGWVGHSPNVGAGQDRSKKTQVGKRDRKRWSRKNT